MMSGTLSGIFLVARVLGVMECGLAVAVKQLLVSVAVHMCTVILVLE